MMFHVKLTLTNRPVGSHTLESIYSFVFPNVRFLNCQNFPPFSGLFFDFSHHLKFIRQQGRKRERERNNIVCGVASSIPQKLILN